MSSLSRSFEDSDRPEQVSNSSDEEQLSSVANIPVNQNNASHQETDRDATTRKEEDDNYQNNIDEDNDYHQSERDMDREEDNAYQSDMNVEADEAHQNNMDAEEDNHQQANMDIEEHINAEEEEAIDSDIESDEEEIDDDIDESDTHTEEGTPAPLFESSMTVDELDTAIDKLLESYLPGILKESAFAILKEIPRYYPVIKIYGLKDKHFKSLFHLIYQRALTKRSITSFVKCLLPRNNISEEYVVKIIGKLSRVDTNIRSVNTLLQWSITVFEYLDSIETISKLYAVLFHYLSFSTVRASICHLLYFLTRSQDVIPYRVRKLQELIEREKQNRELIGLLMVYNTFDSSIKVPINIRLQDMFVFEHPDPDMRQNMRTIRNYWGEQEEHDTLPSFQLPRKPKIPRKKKKEAKMKNREDMDILGIYDDLLKLPYSDQLTTILDDRNMQHLLVCNPDESCIERLSYYLGHELLSTVRWNSIRDKQELKELLRKLMRLSQFSKSQLPIVNLFLKEYLKSWNGIEYVDEIFGLVSFIKPDDYEKIYQSILLPLYRKYYVLDVVWKSKLINCYTEWLKNWALLDWRGHKEQTSATDIDKITWMFDGLSLRVDYFITIQKLIEHVDKISIVGLLAEKDHPLLQHAVLSFFELVSTIPLEYDIPEIIIPSIDLVCRTFFSINAMAVSRICGIIYQYVVAFAENDQKEDDWLSRHAPDYLNMFNTYVTDVCSALWKNKALTVGGNATAFALPEDTIKQFQEIFKNRRDELNSFSSITHSAALAGFSQRFLKGLEKKRRVTLHHDEPVSANSLIKLQEQGGIDIDYFEYRVKFLNYLSKKGLTGIKELLSTCMKSLINYEQQRQASV